MERLYVQGSIRGPITVNLFCKDHKARGVRYQYALPESDKFYLPRYNWEYVYWEKCEAPCSGGAQRAQAVCVEARSGEVDDKYCSSIIKPDDIIRACNQFPCSARWWVGPWSDCDCTDGEGIQTRLVLCLRIPKLDTSRSKVVKEKECCRQPKPRIERPCSPAVEFQLEETTQTLRGKRQMKGMLPYVGIEENFMTEPLVNFRQDLMSATHFPLIAHIKSENFEDKFRAPKISINKARQENRFIKGKEYDEALEPLSKAFNRNVGENLEKRHKKLFPNTRTRLRPNLQELALDQLISNPYNQHRSIHRPRLYNALVDMANKLNQENIGLDRSVGKKEDGLTPIHEVKGESARLPQDVFSKISNKVIRPSVRGHQDSLTLANSTLLVLRPVSEETPVNQCSVLPTTTIGHSTVVHNTTTPATTICTTTECITFNAKQTTIPSTTKNTSWCPLWQITKAPLEKFTSCGLPRATVYEPADLPGWLETANTSSYKLILAPIEPVQCGFPETDAEFQVLGRSGSWPAGDVRNQVAIFGEQVLEALLEGKRRMTKPPPIVETD